MTKLKLEIYEKIKEIILTASKEIIENNVANREQVMCLYISDINFLFEIIDEFKNENEELKRKINSLEEQIRIENEL